jgi:hypothetical protein
MKSLGAKELLNVWENNRGKPLIEKAMDLLYASGSGGVDPTTLSIGERDVRLFHLRKMMFGSNLFNVADCPNCHEHIEWVSNVDDFVLLNQDKRAPVDSYSLDAHAYHIRFRLLNTYDMLRVSSDKIYQSDPNKLFSDCIIEIKRNGENCSVDELPASVFDQLDQRMAEEDPQADITMLLNCPACSNTWEMHFDIISYLWLEIDSWAKHVLSEVATLASVFHWSESDILNLSPGRRRLYLEMVKG